MTAEALHFTPLSRTQEQAALPDGRKLVRCYSPANPHYYADELGALRPIEIERVEDVVSAQAGAISLRSKNVVSSGLRKDGNPEKYLGLRPDDCQALNTESLEFSLISVVLDGEEKKIELTSPRALDNVTQDLGSIIVQSTRRFTRQMVPVSAPIKDFRIEFALHLKGLTPFYRADLDEFWLYNEAGEFRFRIVRPEIIDPKTGDPLQVSEDTPPLQNQIRHSLTANKDGTWSYIKTPGHEFSPEWWPDTVWLDQTTVYSSTADGAVAYLSNADWDVVHDAVTGTETVTTGTSAYGYAYSRIDDAGRYRVCRTFFYFNVSAHVGKTVVSATANFYGHYKKNSPGPILCQLGTQAATLTNADFDSYSGNLWASENYVLSTWNVHTLNAQGISDLQTAVDAAGTLKACVRDKNYDYDDVAPPLNSDNYGAYRMADYSGTTSDPYLDITFSAVGHPAMKRLGGVPHVGINSGIGIRSW